MNLHQFLTDFENLWAKLEARLAALEGKTSASLTSPEQPTVATGPAPMPLSEGFVSPLNGLVIRWADYAGQMDTAAFPAITMKAGGGMTQAQIDAAYASGLIHKNMERDAATHIDYSQNHKGDDLGTGGTWLRRENVKAGDKFTFKFTYDPANRVHGAGDTVRVIGTGLIHFQGGMDFVVMQGTTTAKSGTATCGNYAGVPSWAVPVKDLSPGQYTITVSFGPQTLPTDDTANRYFDVQVQN